VFSLPFIYGPLSVHVLELRLQVNYRSCKQRGWVVGECRGPGKPSQRDYHLKSLMLQAFGQRQKMRQEIGRKIEGWEHLLSLLQSGDSPACR